MVNQQLVDYLISLQSGNHSKAQVRRVLLEVGWPEKEIEEAFKTAQTHHEVTMPSISLSEKSFLIQTLSVLLILMTGTFLIFGSEPTATGNVVLNVAPVQSLGVPNEIRVTEEQNAPSLISIPTAQQDPVLNINVQEQVTAPAQPVFIPEPAPTITVISPAPEPECGEANKGTDKCLMKTAIEQKDSKLCARIRTAQTYSDCMTQLAAATKNLALCRETAESDLCFNEYAEQTGDKTACSRIAKGTLRETCQS